MGQIRRQMENEILRQGRQLVDRMLFGGGNNDPQLDQGSSPATRQSKEESIAYGPRVYGEAHAAFRYIVKVGGEKKGAFVECKLPTIEWEFEVVKEGGLNSQVHQLPIRRKPAKLMLKNGVGTRSFMDWFKQVLENSPNIKDYRKNMSIQLIDGQEKVIQTWVINGAFPSKWEGPQLKSDSTSIAIQTLEFVCGNVHVE